MMRRSHLCCHYLLSFLSFLITKIIVSSTTPVEEWVTVVLQMFDIVVDCDCWEAAEKINWQKMSQMFAKIWIELQKYFALDLAKYLVRILQHLHSVRSEERDQHAVLQTIILRMVKSWATSFHNKKNDIFCCLHQLLPACVTSSLL